MFVSHRSIRWDVYWKWMFQISTQKYFILLLHVSIIIIKIDYLLVRRVSACMLFWTAMWILDFNCTYIISVRTHTSHDQHLSFKYHKKPKSSLRFAVTWRRPIQVETCTGISSNIIIIIQYSVWQQVQSLLQEIPPHSAI